MEHSPFPTKEILRAPLSYTEYFTQLPQYKPLINGVVPRSTVHAFYLWYAQTHPMHVVGNSKDERIAVVTAYETNVIKNQMPEARFLQWCKAHNLPALPSEEYETFLRWYNEEKFRLSKEYETWAAQRGIDTTPGAKMIFEYEGKEKVVATSTDHRGEVKE